MSQPAKERERKMSQPASVIPAPKTTVKEKMVQTVTSIIKKSKDKKKINPN
ncbi:hypothetical protein LOK49_LG08G01497 [Camellia lanceoleosa]|uniref:Uncharacterized protein n=1 Tax=Camellia lanceoleosa TaxID=1840588 RepID=A0ACC0GNM0_9ERIC|nr:hypothetical protein LOK49_LG08G01497 [Camellia lanceoleosa]